MKRLTTSEVATRLNVAQVTVNVWCLRGKFPNAVKEETARGPVWTIPEDDLRSFVKPMAGRPPQAKPEAPSTTNGTTKRTAAKKAAKKGSRK